DRLDAVHELTGNGELNDVRITQHFELRLRELPAQGGNRGKREDEVTDRAAANDEDFAALLHDQVGRRSAATGWQHGIYIARNAVKPSIATNNPNASRMPEPTRTRVSLAVAQFSASRNRHGEMVSQIPATTST